jgi:hypothetical protein
VGYHADGMIDLAMAAPLSLARDAVAPNRTRIEAAIR